MDPKKHPLIEVAELLDSLRPASPGMYLLHAYHHELNCCHCPLAPKDAVQIAILTSQAINEGLTSNMWNQIEARIRTYIKQGVLEWQPQKL